MRMIGRRDCERGAAVCLLFLFLVLLWAGMVRPLWILWVDHVARIALSQQLLERYRDITATRPALKTEIEQMQRRSGRLEGTVQGDNSAIASASLETTIKSIIESEHGDIRSVQSLPISHMHGFDRIELRYDLVVPVGSLENLMYRLETHVPYVWLDGVDIRAPLDGNGAELAQNEPRLAVHWDVQAYRATGEK